MSLQASAQAQLRQLIEQIERLEEEKKAIADDVKDKFLEAKSVGFDPKILRKIISLRKKDDNERQEEEAILDVYLHALGMLLDDPSETDTVSSPVAVPTAAIVPAPEAAPAPEAVSSLNTVASDDGPEATMQAAE